MGCGAVDTIFRNLLVRVVYVIKFLESLKVDGGDSRDDEVTLSVVEVVQVVPRITVLPAMLYES